MTPLSGRAGTRRLLDRFGFGLSPGDPNGPCNNARSQLLTGATNEVDLLPHGDQPPVDSKDPVGKMAGEKVLSQQSATLISWWLDRMVTSSRPLSEKLTWFWHGPLRHRCFDCA